MKYLMSGSRWQDS